MRAWLVVLVLSGDPSKLAREYVAAVAAVNEAQARRSVAEDESELARRLPAAASRALEELLAEDPGSETAAALLECGEAALDLDRLADFERVRAALEARDPTAAARLGVALSRPRFLARGLDGVEEPGLLAVADAFERVLDGYRELFGLTAFSKVPGQKLRLRVHLVPSITSPPHFAPQFPFHSEIDFPVVDPRRFASPTEDGKFLLYGLCHELGHVLAMWGDAGREEDHHAWAHYTGVAVVEHLARTRAEDPALAALRDARWRALGLERARLAEERRAPGLEDRDGVLALLVALHDAVGPAAIGAALDALDRAGEHRRVQRVRYYALKDFRRALLATEAGRKKRKELAALFP